MKYINFLMLFILVLIFSCTSGNVPKTKSDSLSESGSYIFTIMDSIENTLAEGTLIITDNLEYKIKGNYNFDSIYMEFKGLSSMSGKFDGIINPASKTLLINTNPGTADDNVFFDLKIKKEIMKGTWYYSAFRQQNINGKIVLIKKNNN